MDLNTIRQALREEPFKPFTLHLADGRKESVGHPEFVAVGSRVVAVVRDDNSVTTIEPLLIVSLETEPIKKKRRNGAPKKKRGK